MTPHEKFMVEILFELKQDVDNIGYLDKVSAITLISTCIDLLISREDMYKQLVYSMNNDGLILDSVRVYQ